MKKLKYIILLVAFVLILSTSVFSLGYNQTCIASGNPSNNASNYTKSYLNNLTEKYTATVGAGTSKERKIAIYREFR